MSRRHNTRDAKLQHQALAREQRSNRTSKVKTAAFPAALNALTQGLANGYLPVISPAGEVRDLTYSKLRDHLNARSLASGEPPIGAADLASWLSVDLIIGDLAMRTDGLWTVPEKYLAALEIQP